MAQFAKEFDEMNVYFTGEHDRVVSDKAVSAPVVIDEDEGIIIPGKQVTELDRLSHVVWSIDESCGIVPKGALKFTPLKEATLNEGFRGLD